MCNFWLKIAWIVLSLFHPACAQSPEGFRARVCSRTQEVDVDVIEGKLDVQTKFWGIDQIIAAGKVLQIT